MTEVTASDAKRSFGWAQFFVGSILSGFAVYQLGLKAMAMPPSEILAGFVATYEAVRDFLMLPFTWLALDLSASTKDYLTICVILIGAAVRTAIDFPKFWIFLGIVALSIVAVAASAYEAHSPLDVFMENASLIIILGLVGSPAFMVVFDAVLGRVFGAPQTTHEMSFILKCIVSTACVGVVLIALNSATS